MTNDAGTLAAALYATTDGMLKEHPGLAPWRTPAGITPRLSDAELVTPATMQAILGCTSDVRAVDGSAGLYYGDAGGDMGVLRGVRAGLPRPRGMPGPYAVGLALSWIGDERIAVSGVPSARVVAGLAGRGVTHVVNCRPRALVRWSGDLAAERAAFGPGRVAHAPMADHGLRQPPAAWAPAACFAARVLEDEPQAGVLIHCTAGRRRSAMVAYAVLRLRGHDRTQAAALVLRYRTEAVLVPAYVRSVEEWLAAAAR